MRGASGQNREIKKGLSKIFFLSAIFMFGRCGSLLHELDRIKNKSQPQLPVAAAPVFSPAPDAYYTAQSVTIAAANTICYTTDGSQPACNGDTCAVGQVFSAPISLAAPVLAAVTTSINAIGCKAGMADSAVVNAVYTIDTTLPVLLSSSPANAATNATPCGSTAFSAHCRGAITLVFSKRMNTALVPALTLDIFDGVTYVNVPVTSNYSFSRTNVNNDTIIVGTHWPQFPEMSQLRYTIPASALQDETGIQIAAQIQRTFTTTLAPASYPVSDSGQTSCYNAAILQVCPTAGFPRQDGDMTNTPNARSFAGPSAHVTYATDYVTTDNLTGLLWKACSEGLSGATCATGVVATFTWYTALGQCVALNTANGGAGYWGRRDWRLPTLRELETLPNYGTFSPAIDTVSFPATQSNRYWTSSTYRLTPANAWSVFFYSGFSDASVKTTLFNTRCVSGGKPLVNPAVIDYNDGTIFDSGSNLVWTKCSMDTSGTGTLQNYTTNCMNLPAGSRTWSQALTDCANLTLAGRSWRMPNTREIKTLADRSVNSPAIRSGYFPATASATYWSSTSWVSGPSQAWNLSFADGADLSGLMKTSAYLVRCVATGP